MAIFISSHNLAELESFCTKVCIIKNGKVIETATIEELQAETKDERSVYEVEVNNTETICKFIEENDQDNNMQIEIKDNTHLKITIKKENVPEFIELLIKNKIKIYEFKEEKISLEDAFLKRTGGNVIG